MKKFFAAMVMTMLILSAGAVFAAPAVLQPQRDVLTTSGVIQAVDGDRLTIVGEGSFKEVILTANPATYILRGDNGQDMTLDQLKSGDAITAYYGMQLTKSIPPQGQAIALVIGSPADSAFYLRVNSREVLLNGDLRVLNSNQDSLITIPQDKYADLAKIQVGSEILVWYKMMALSMPGQATATKVVVLPNTAIKDDIFAHLLAGTVAVAGSEISVAQGPVIVEKNNTVYLPLRAVVEKLGYKVNWDADKQAIIVMQGARSAQLSIGSQDYGKAKMRVRLGQAPELINGQTFVPVSFFSDVLDVNVRVLKDHV